VEALAAAESLRLRKPALIAAAETGLLLLWQGLQLSLLALWAAAHSGRSLHRCCQCWELCLPTAGLQKEAML
jgi:hypothetical protein